MKKTVLRVAITVVLIALLLRQLDLGRTWETIRQVAWGYWLAAWAVYVSAQILSSVRWQILAQPIGIQRKLSRFISLYFVGNFFNQLLPTSMGGDVARGWYLSDTTEERWPAFLSVFADRLSGLGVLILLACVATCFVPLSNWMLIWIISMGLGLIVGLGLLAWIGSQAIDRFQSTICRRLHVLVNTYRHSWARIGIVTFLSALVQLGNVLLVWCICRAVGLQISFGFCCLLMPLVTLVTLLPISINGLGVREGCTVFLLTPLGVAAETSVIIALLWLTVFAMTGLIGAGIYLQSSFMKKKAQSHDRPIDSCSDQGRTRQPATAA